MIFGADNKVAAINAVEVTSDTADIVVNITYVADNKYMHIIYTDRNDEVVRIDKVSSQTDQTVNVNSNVPNGWKLLDNEKIPATIHFTGTPIADIKLTIEHSFTKVTHDKPVELNSKTITGQTISGAHQNDLNQVITRKITIYEPDKKVQTIKQIARIYRNAMIDNVTGKVKYNDWSNRSKYSHHL